MKVENPLKINKSITIADLRREFNRHEKRLDEKFKHIDEEFKNLDKKFIGRKEFQVHDDLMSRMFGIMMQRFDKTDANFLEIDRRFDGIDRRFNSFEQTTANLLLELKEMRQEVNILYSSNHHNERDIADVDARVLQLELAK